jgi:flagellar capping protein FliD
LNNAANNIATSVGGQEYSFDSGSFVINGATITIDPAADTLYDVVSRINSSTAGVLATLEVTGSDYQLRIESEEEGDEEIAITSDTTNFLTIMRVNTEGSFHEGVDPYWEQPIDYVLANHPDSPLRSVVDGNFMINGVNFEVDTAEDSLQDIVNKINNSQAGVSVFYDEELDYLSVSAKETGADIVFGDANQQGDTSGFLANVLGLDLASGTVTVAHTDASVEVNDTVITPDGNTFTINGTTFTLHANTAAETVNVEVNRNTAGAKTGIENFIAKYNALYDLIESKNQEGSPLNSNRLLLSIRSQLRSYVLSAISNSGAYDFLRDVGIEFSSGKLSLDASKLDDAFRSDPDSVAELFGFDSDGDGLRDDGGFSCTMIDNYISQLTLASSGDIGQRLSYISSRTDRINSKIQKENSRLYRKEAQLWEEYSRLAEAIARMTQQFQTASSQMSGLTSLMNQMYSSGTAAV